jgi:hypothetical protein
MDERDDTTAYREPPAPCVEWLRRWAPAALAEIHDALSDPACIAELALALADCAVRGVVPLALQAQGFDHEALLLRALEPLRDDRSCAAAAALARETVRGAGARGMKFYHALGSAAMAVDEANQLRGSSETTSSDPELHAFSLEGMLVTIFGVSGALDMCAYRSIGGGAPRERVLQLFHDAVTAVARSRERKRSG